MNTAKKTVVNVIVLALAVSAGSAMSLAQTTGAAAPAKPAVPAAPSQPKTPPADSKPTVDVAPVSAQSGAKPDGQATAAASAEKALLVVPVHIVEVRGSVGYTIVGEPNAKNVMLKGGETLTHGVIFTLGASKAKPPAVMIRVGENQVFTLDQPGKTELRLAVRDGEVTVTRFEVKQGRLSFDVDSTKSKNDVKIQTPDMTLAIKGTSGALEVANGFGTRAFGDLENRGRIEVDWTNGIKAVMTRNEQTDSSTKDPARNADAVANVDSSRSDSRDKDERRLLKRAASAKQDVELNVGNTKGVGGSPSLLPDVINPAPPVVIPTPTNIQHLDAVRGTFFQTTPGLSSTLLRSGISVNPGTITGGSAILHDGSSIAGRFVYLEGSSPSAGKILNTFSEIPYSTSESSPRELASLFGDASETPMLNGLGTLGSSLFASGSLAGRSGIYNVDLARGEITHAMDLGVALEGALGGSTANGTLFAIGRDPGAAPSALLLDRSVLLEVDPRTNFLVAAYPNLGGGSLGSSSSGANSSGVDLATLQSITGLAAVDGGVVMSAVSDSNGGRTVLMRYETGGGPSAVGPHLADVRRAPETITHGLASEAAGTPRASMPLSDPAGRIDRVSISAAFAGLGYSQQALNSGFVERAVQREILATSTNPSGCAASGALGSLRSMLQNHLHERAGVGRTVAEFRDALPMGHPCK